MLAPWTIIRRAGLYSSVRQVCCSVIGRDILGCQSTANRLGASSRKTSLPNPNVGSSFSSYADSKQKLSTIQGQSKGGNSGTLLLQKIMPPISEDPTPELKQTIESNEVVIFSKTTCPFCVKAKDLFKSLNVKFEAVELDVIENGSKYQTALKDLSGQSTVPNIYIHGQHLGGCDNLLKMHADNRLSDILSKKAKIEHFDNDLIVIGGGSGGLAAAKEAASFGKKVTLFDFVTPSPPGTTWGLGGTCVNVGCIPKKLMHRASILGEDMGDARQFGWEISAKVNHNWETMKNNIQDHIGSLNWGYRVALRDKKVNYVNAYAEIVNKNTVLATKKNKQTVSVTAHHILIATGERPRYPDIPGAREYCITSDDLFSLPYSPGKTLCVGASYVSLECAGFLAGIGLDTTVMVRSILLRGFDQQCAELIGTYMEKHGVKFIRGAVPTKIEQIESGQPGRYKVTAIANNGQEIVEEYNTILLAIGRDPCTRNIGLDKVGVQLSDKSRRVIVNPEEQTNIPNVYAIGDIGEGRPELTPVAIQAGRLLARRLYQPKGPKKLVDYTNIATTVFTPLEYGCIGYSEEAAVDKFGEEKIEIFHSFFHPLEWTVPHKDENTCYAKLICKRDENNKVIGFHVLGPNAGEITQGYAVAMKKGVTKDDFDDTIGIHPTNSEIFTSLKVTKRSGETAEVTGC